MNEKGSVLSQGDIEKYIYRKLNEAYSKFPEKIVSSTTFRELDRYEDADLVAPELLMDIEEDLGIFLPDEAVDALDDEDVSVGALINTVIRHSPMVAKGAASLSEEISTNDKWFLAEQIVKPFIERFYPKEFVKIDQVLNTYRQTRHQSTPTRNKTIQVNAEPVQVAGTGFDVRRRRRRRKLDSVLLMELTLEILEDIRQLLEGNNDMNLLARLRTGEQNKRLIEHFRKRGIRRKAADGFVNHLLNTLQTL
jgi:acyl carrier protein